MEHPALKMTGDIAAWMLLAAAFKGILPTLALVLGIGWHLCQLYQFFEKRYNKKKQFKRRASDTK